MIKELNINDVLVAKSVLELQKASYKIEADIIGFQDIPPLKDTIESLIQCEETFFGYYLNDVLAGIISFKFIGNVLDIHRTAVHPDFFRMGIAQKLLLYTERLKSNIYKIKVCTGKANIPAVNLYLKNGYKKSMI